MVLPKSLIPDANILFSFFKPDSVRKKVFRELLKYGMEFSAPKILIEEILSEKDEIKKYSYIDDWEFSYLFKLLDKQINKFPEEDFSEFIKEALSLAPHAKDVQYFALALSLKIPIWSDEKSFKKQSEIKIFSTADLLKLVSSTDPEDKE